MTKPVVMTNVFPDDNKGGCAITLETIGWLKREFPGSPVYLVPVEHTRRAREILGAGALLIPEQKVVLAAYPSEARRRARAATAWYLDTPNYLENLRWLGFSDDDFANGRSDALVDALVAARDEDAILTRVREHLDAGADHVCVQFRSQDPGELAIETYGELLAAVRDIG